MTAFTEFFCNYCNPAEQRPEASERGYARELAPNTPLGWWEVPRLGPGDTPGHACPQCVMDKSGTVYGDIARRRAEESRRLTGEQPRPTHDRVILDTDERESGDPAPGWPARTPPFDG